MCSIPIFALVVGPALSSSLFIIITQHVLCVCLCLSAFTALVWVYVAFVISPRCLFVYAVFMLCLGCVYGGP